jgi:hypothetical protein
MRIGNCLGMTLVVSTTKVSNSKIAIDQGHEPLIQRAHRGELQNQLVEIFSGTACLSYGTFLDNLLSKILTLNANRFRHLLDTN